MRGMLRVALVAGLLAVGMAGCNDFLEPDDAVNDPNDPTEASRDQLFVGVQAGQFTTQEGGLALLVCLWMQQCQGVGGRFVQQRSQYTFTEIDYRADFSQIYIGGGLVDLRAIQQSAEADGDRIYAGIAKVWEAFTIGTAADIWGDIPYREAASDVATPALDPQLQVYDDIQALLDEAIADLASGAGPGPGPVDLIYDGDTTKWREAAYTLKARYYLHTVEVRGPGEYANAIATATNGISDPANNFTTFHTSATFERNIWNQFNVSSGFGDDAVAGKTLVDLMVAQNDPRLPEYFSEASAGGYVGVDISGTPPSEGNPSLLEGTRNAPDFRQPLITWAENQLILAEANFVLNGSPAAQPYLDAVRSRFGLPSVPATLESIMEEKYIALFQNLEVWNDYKRTCLPALTPYETEVFAHQIPGRLFYGETERNANPNVPDTETQLANGGVRIGGPSVGGFRNPNDPNPCP